MSDANASRASFINYVFIVDLCLLPSILGIVDCEESNKIKFPSYEFETTARNEIIVFVFFATVNVVHNSDGLDGNLTAISF